MGGSSSGLDRTLHHPYITLNPNIARASLNSLHFRKDWGKEAAEEKSDTSRGWCMRSEERTHESKVSSKCGCRRCREAEWWRCHTEQCSTADQPAWHWNRMPARTVLKRQKSMPGFKGQAELSHWGIMQLVTQAEANSQLPLEHPRILKNDAEATLPVL